MIPSCADDSDKDTDEDMDNDKQQSSPIPSLTEIKCLQRIKQQLCHKNFLFQLEILVFIVSEIFLFLNILSLFIYTSSLSRTGADDLYQMVNSAENALNRNLILCQTETTWDNFFGKSDEVMEIETPEKDIAEKENNKKEISAVLFFQCFLYFVFIVIFL